MMMMTTTIDLRWPPLLGFAVLVLATSAPPLAAQQPAAQPLPAPAELVRPAGEEYRSAYGGEALSGSNWRHLWVRPLALRTLNIGDFAGGLEPERQGGGNQSITLHFVDAKGKGWVFRSLNKYPDRTLPPDLDGTFVQDVLKDQVSALHPGGHFVVPRLLDALGILHVTPALYIMPDDARLGEFRETFAGMIGILEEKPEEGPDDTPGFAGSRKVKSTANFFDDLEDSPDYRLDDHEFLRARVLDILVNDTDRGTDQWRWARFGEEGNYTYRPVPRDRDWTFVNAGGVMSFITKALLPKHTDFGRGFPSLTALTFSSHVMDRRLLMRLSRADFERAVAAVQSRITDEVIAEAVADLPPTLQPGHADALAADLRARRAGLREVVLDWYDWLFTEADIHATDEADRATIQHLPDGGLHLSIARGEGGEPYYDRVFDPAETNEVRVFLHGGNDHAVVSGEPGDIEVRVIGGGADDTLEDRAGGAHFYDEKGDNEYRRASGTTVSEKPWYQPEAPEGLRMGREWSPDWGRDTGFGPKFDYREGAGVIVGASRKITQRGFRRLPYAWSLDLSALYATGSNGFGGKAEYDSRFENSRFGVNALVSGSQFEAFRFYGLGNDTPDLGDGTSLIMQDQLRGFLGITYRFGPLPGQYQPTAAAGDDDDEASADEEQEEGGSQNPFATDRARGLEGHLSIGPVVQWTRSYSPDESPLEGSSGTGSDGFGMVGAHARLELSRTDRPAAPHMGFALRAEASGFPGVWDAAEAFGNVALSGSAYLPLLGETHVAVRAGAERAFGEFPAFASAFVGGRTSLRGYRFERFAGDAAAFGGAELRIPLDTVKLVLNGELGVFGLADAGRVWVDGASPGGWHTAYGGGVWFATMNRSLSLTYAHGERDRIYFWLGLPF